MRYTVDMCIELCLEYISPGCGQGFVFFKAPGVLMVGRTCQFMLTL